MALFTLLTEGVTNNGTLATDALFAFCIVAIFCEVKWNIRAVLLRLVEAAVLFLLIEVLGIVCDVIGISGFPGPTFPALLAVLAVYALLQARLSLTDRIVRAASFAALFMVIVGFTGVIARVFTDLNEVSWGYSVPSALSYVCMVVSALFVRHFSIEQFAFVPQSFVSLAVAIDALAAIVAEVFIVLIDVSPFFDEAEYESGDIATLNEAFAVANLLVDIVFFVLILLSCYMFYTLAREHDERAELLVTKKSTVDSVAIMRVTKTMYDQLRELRHEIKNHDAYLVSLIDAGDFGKVRSFLTDGSDEYASSLRRVASGNLAIDTVVNAKIALAHDQNVKIETMLAVPAQLPFDEGDIFRLLANLLDNAIEGTVAARVEQGTVTLKILPEGGYWFITVSNPCDPAKVVPRGDGTLRTSKPDHDIHGYGTRVIKRIAERYRGTVRFTVEERMFTASVMLARDDEVKAG